MIGLDRESQGKPAGLRTHALVALGAATLTIVGLLLQASDTGAPSRVLQGIVAGIGFIGAGVILHRHDGRGIEGLTTAAAIWMRRRRRRRGRRRPVAQPRRPWWRPWAGCPGPAVPHRAAVASCRRRLKDKTPGIPRTADGKPDFAAPAPRTPEGRPDLSGIWRVDPGGYSDNIASDLKPGEVLPLGRGPGEAAIRGVRDLPSDLSLPARDRPVRSLGMFKILQTPGTTGVLSENGRYRQILTDGRALPVDPNPTWEGYSVGRWEDDVFVVTSAGFNDKTWLDYAGHPHTEALRVTERYRRKNFGELELQMTFDDPETYARPWTISLTGRLAADTELLE